MRDERLLKEFDNIFGNSNEEKRYFFSPGRVNLIGEHLDYNGGNVLPCAINMGNTIIVRYNGTDKIRAYSDSFKEEGILEVDRKKSMGNWTSYLTGALDLTKYDKDGFDVFVSGNLPAGAGLSSSASVACGFVFMLNTLMNKKIDRLEIALTAQKIEHNYIGVNCGIMDQYAIVFGEKDKAVMLDTLNLTHRLVNFTLKDYDLVISNTNKKRELKGSEYNDRRKACETAAALLKKPLCKAELSELENLELDDFTRKIAEYVIEEEKRVERAVIELENNRLEEFGKLMNESHKGLAEKFKVTVDELDFVSEKMREMGALGSRMTGAGFGGCVVSIIKKEKTEETLKKLSDMYNKRFSLNLDNYIVYPSDSTKEEK